MAGNLTNAGSAANNATISAGPANYKFNYCQKQAAAASLESILPFGSVLLGGNYSPSNVLSETAKEGASEAGDWAAGAASFLRGVRSLFGVSMSSTSRFLKFAGSAASAYGAYQALSAGQEAFAACME